MATKKKILLVIDVQNDFITGALRNEEAIKTLPNIVNLVKNNDWITSLYRLSNACFYFKYFTWYRSGYFYASSILTVSGAVIS